MDGKRHLNHLSSVSVQRRRWVILTFRSTDTPDLCCEMVLQLNYRQKRKSIHTSCNY